MIRLRGVKSQNRGKEKSMGNKLRRIFSPTPEDQEEIFQNLLKWHNNRKKERGCSTCKHCIHVINYPGFVTAEECECDAGLECDTVLHSVKKCPKWQEKEIKRWWID